MQEVSEIRVSLWRLMVMTVHLGSLRPGERKSTTTQDTDYVSDVVRSWPMSRYGGPSKSMNDAQALKSVSGVAYCPEWVSP